MLNYREDKLKEYFTDDGILLALAKKLMLVEIHTQEHWMQKYMQLLAIVERYQGFKLICNMGNVQDMELLIVRNE